MKAMTVSEIKAQFSEVLEQVKHGETFGILYGRKKEPIAMIVPFVAPEEKTERTLGTMVSRDAEFEKFVPHGLRLLWQ